MATQWLRRAWLVAASSAAALLIAACGGGTVASQFIPERVVAFGDAFADLGQAGARYTVNDTSVDRNWTEYVARSYGRTLAASSAGGFSYATGNARVTATPDAAGGSAPTVTSQITTFLGTGAPLASDLVLVSAGTSDVIANAKAVIDNLQTQDAALNAVGQAGRELAAQVNRLVQAGAKHVVVVGPYNLGRSPWAVQTNRFGLLEALSGRFNDQLLIQLHNFDLGQSVLYVDAALYFNLVTSDPGGSGLGNGTNPVCNSVDSGPGIGTGTNQVNSRLCTPSTLIAGADHNRYLFADRVYPTPAGQRLFGEVAVGKVKDRW